MTRTWWAAAAVALGVATSAVGVNVAQADPVGGSQPVMAGVGSLDTQAVVNAILVKNGYTVSSAGRAGCASAPHPTGSASGRAALIASLQAGDGCIQYSRSLVLDLTP